MDVRVREPAPAYTHTISYPTGTAQGDILVFFVGMHDVPRHVLFAWTNHAHGGIKGFGEDTGLQVAWRRVGTETSTTMTYEASISDHHSVSAAPVVMILHLVAGVDFKRGGTWGVNTDITKRGFSQADPTDTTNPGPANIAYDPIDAPDALSVDHTFYFASWYETGLTIASYTKPPTWTLVKNYNTSAGEWFSMWSYRATAAEVTPGNSSVLMKADSSYPTGYYNMNNHDISCGFVVPMP